MKQECYEHSKNLAQHFEHYFEFLLDSERAKFARHLHISTDTENDLFSMIECRMAYLKGAVRMAKLLCLITGDEARSRYQELTDEQTRMRSRVGRHVSGEIKLEPCSQQKRDFKSLLK